MLNTEGLVATSALNNGIQHLYRFPNDRGASVVKHDYSYGHERDLWELAVLTWDGASWDLDYSTDITSDVVTSLTEDEVNDLLVRIATL